MRRRLSDHIRCPGCRLHRPLCMCALIPRIETRTYLVLVLHQLEAHKPSNTGRLATSCLPSSRIIVRGRGEPVTAHERWPQGHQPLVLYPHETARAIEDFRRSETPIALIVPDGTWPQAAKVKNRMFPDVQAVRLPDGLETSYRLRNARIEGRLSTIEAIATALGILEDDPTVEERLRTVGRIMVERTLWTNGRLQADEVTGGIPKGLHYNGKEVV